MKQANIKELAKCSGHVENLVPPVSRLARLCSRTFKFRGFLISHSKVCCITVMNTQCGQQKKQNHVKTSSMPQSPKSEINYLRNNIYCSF